MTLESIKFDDLRVLKKFDSEVYEIWWLQSLCKEWLKSL